MKEAAARTADPSRTRQHPEASKAPRDVSVSVLIVNWNTRDLLAQALRALRAAVARAENFGTEIIVVDNGSSDGSVEMVERDFPEVRLASNTENRGFAAANNQAIEISLGESVLLVNSDCFVEEDTLAEMQAFMEHHREAGVVGCRLVRPSGELQVSHAHFPSVQSVLFESPFVRECAGVREKEGEAEEVDWVAGACMMVRREAIAEAGLLDERFFMYGEEVEWCYRIKQAGWKVFFYPRPAAVHIGEASSSGTSPDRATKRLTAAVKFLRKHRRASYALAFKLAVVLAALPRLVAWAVIWGTAPRKRARAAAGISWHANALKWCIEREAGSS